MAPKEYFILNNIKKDLKKENVPHILTAFVKGNNNIKMNSIFKKFLTAKGKLDKTIEQKFTVNGKEYIYQKRTSNIYDEKNNLIGNISYIEDITEQRGNVCHIYELQAVLDHIFEGVCFLQKDGYIRYVNIAMEKIVGFSKKELTNKNFFDVVDKEYKTFIQEKLKNIQEPFKVKLRSKSGQEQWVLMLADTVRLFGEEFIMVAVMDLSEHMQKDLLIEYLANYDLLTGLYNRKFFLEYMDDKIKEYSENSYYGALLFIDIDNFREINEIEGHELGDLLLIEMKNRLLKLVKDGLVARVGGDEFLIFCDFHIKNQKAAMRTARMRAKEIQKKLNETYTIEGKKIQITVSIGIALLEPNLDLAQLMRHVDIALYRAKVKHENAIIIFNEKYLEILTKQLTIREKIKEALKKEEFKVALQPKVKIVDGRSVVVGYESLVRWIHEGKIVPPMEFIPILEESPLIYEFGDYFLGKVCGILRSKKGTIAVNISPKQFEHDEFVQSVKRIVTKSGVDPSRLVFEITENMLLKNIEEALVKIEQLTKFGIQFSVDDFGTGFSSFEYLKKLPLSELKIDKSFVLNIENDSNDYAIVEAITDIGHIFGLRVVAEGIENEVQLTILQKIGVDIFQGYYFGKPQIIT